MGAITRIRQLSPYFLAVVALLFIVFMVLQDSSCSSIQQQQRNPENISIAEINGESISQAEFERRVHDYSERLRQQNAQMTAQGQTPQEIDDEQVRQQIFDQMVEEILLKQEADKLGIVVTDDEIVDVMLINPPQELQFFKDSTGKFQKQMYQELVTNPQRYGEILQEQGMPQEQVDQQQKVWNETLRDIEHNLRTMKLQEAVASTVTAAVSTVSPTWAEIDYRNSNSTANIRFVAVTPGQGAEQGIKPTQDELKAYYDQNKQYMVQKPTRKIKYAVFRQVASKKDSARAQKLSEDLMKAFAPVTDVAQRDSLFTEKMGQLGGTTSDYTRVSNLDPTISMVLTTTPVRDVFGPLNTATGIKYLRVDDKRAGVNEVVRASHILIPFEANKDSARTVAENIIARAKKGEDFATLAMLNSKDPGSAQNGGDLGYFEKGKMVPEFEKAAFGAQIGDIVGPVETQFGFHIIKVTDKQSTEIKYSEISIAPKISTTTKQSIISNGLKMEEMLNNGSDFDTVAKKFDVKAMESNFFSSRTPVVGSHEITAWAFAAGKGDIKRFDVNNMGLVVAQVSEIREQGIKLFEDVKEEIERVVIQNKVLDQLKSKAEKVAQACTAAGSLEAAASIDSALTVRVQTALRNNGQLSGFGADFVSTNTAFTTPIGSITGPIRGKRAWIIMVVDSRTPANMDAFNKDKTSQIQNLMSRQRSSAYYSWLQSIKDNATIVDKRWDRD